MITRLLSVPLVLAFVSQGVVRAAEPARSIDVMTMPDHAALIAHVDALTVGERVVVVTADDIVAGDLVDKDGDDLVVDRPLVEGGAERIAIPLREIQDLRYQPANVQHTSKCKVIADVLAVVVVASLIFAAWTRFQPIP